MVAIDELKLDQWANNMLIDNPIEIFGKLYMSDISRVIASQ